MGDKWRDLLLNGFRVGSYFSVNHDDLLFICTFHGTI